MRDLPARGAQGQVRGHGETSGVGGVGENQHRRFGNDGATVGVRSPETCPTLDLGDPAAVVCLDGDGVAGDVGPAQ